MSRYIDADKLLKALQGRYESALSWYDNVIDSDLKIRAEQAVATFLECILTLKAQSTADVEEVRHGEPKLNRGDSAKRYYCPFCYEYLKSENHYCPNCGAKMYKEKEE